MCTQKLFKLDNNKLKRKKRRYFKTLCVNITDLGLNTS